MLKMQIQLYSQVHKCILPEVDLCTKGRLHGYLTLTYFCRQAAVLALLCFGLKGERGSEITGYRDGISLSHKVGSARGTLSWCCERLQAAVTAYHLMRPRMLVCQPGHIKKSHCKMQKVDFVKKSTKIKNKFKNQQCHLSDYRLTAKQT